MHQIQTYQNIGEVSEVMGASSLRLIQLLYDKLEFVLEEAKRIGETGDFRAQRRYIIHANSIARYLYGCLNHGDEFGIAQGLANLYLFLIHQQTLAMQEKNPQLLKSCITVVSNLKGAWYDISQ